MEEGEANGLHLLISKKKNCLLALQMHENLAVEDILQIKD